MNKRLARLGRALGIAGLLLGAPGAAAQFILDAVPGGLVEIPLASLDQARPEAYFGQRRILVTKFARRWVGLAGLPLSLAPGSYVIRVDLEDSEDPQARAFMVYPGRGAGRSVIDLPGLPVDMPEVALDWRESLDAGLPLNAPVARRAQPTFGHYRRTPGGEPSHVDCVAFAITDETPVTAPGAGRVAATWQHESGIYIWIDHGMALYTRLGPLATTSLGVSDAVEADQPVGRARPDKDGAERLLCLAVFLNGAAVNPFLISNIEKTPAHGSEAGAGR